MQTQKDHIRFAILTAAREEFLRAGFRQASLRKIAAQSHVTLSNIYNYFPDKNALFLELCQPLVDQIRDALTQLKSGENDHDHADEASHLHMTDAPIDFVHRNREMCKLLLFKAAGSSLENYKLELMDWFFAMMHEEVELMMKKHGVQGEIPSEFIIRHIGSLWVQLIEHSLQNDLPPKQVKQIATELMRFMYHGWIGFLGIHHP